MRRPATFRSVVAADITRCRLRPVIGRGPLLGALGTALVCGLVQASHVGVDRPQEVRDVVSIGSTVVVLASVVVGAAVTADARSSGMDATDRSMVGRPRWIASAHIVAITVWVGWSVLIIGASAVVSLIAGAALQGHVDAPLAWTLLAVPALGQAAVGAALGAGAGASGSLILRSPSTTIAVFLGLLLVGDGLVVMRAPALVPALLPDNLLGLASGQLEGLAVRSSSWTIVSVSALLGSATLAALAVVVDARRDVGA